MMCHQKERCSFHCVFLKKYFCAATGESETSKRILVDRQSKYRLYTLPKQKYDVCNQLLYLVLVLFGVMRYW